MAEAETKKDFGDPPTGKVGLWLAEIKAYEKTFDSWAKRAERVVKRYRNETQSDNPDRIDNSKKFNILWSNIQTLQPALYSRPPKPDITRTYKDRSPVARAAATILERAARTQVLSGGFDGAMRSTRDDYLLSGRGQAWVRYVPTYGEEQRDKIFLQADTKEDGTKAYLKPDGSQANLGDATEPKVIDGQPYIEEGEPYTPVVAECVKQEHVAWADFGHTPAPNWSKVRAVWKREMMTREQLVERFGEDKGKAVSLNRAVPNVGADAAEAYGDAFKRGEVFEIWDKSSGKVLWISQGYTDGPLDEIDDPLHLEGFFPCPQPVYGTTTPDSLVPIPDYDEYRTQAEEIDRLTQRISLLTEALKVAGAYDGNTPELGKIFASQENTLVPVDNWAMFAEKGGITGAISFLPIKEIAETITALGSIRQAVKQDIQEITGISDIVRGQSDPNETLGAQNIKRQFVGMRIKDRQDSIERFARDIVKITAEIIAEQFSPETLWEISGWEHTDEARALDKALADWEKAQQAQMQQVMPMMGHNGPPPGPMDMPPADSRGVTGGLPGNGAASLAPDVPMPPMPAQTDRPPSGRDIFDQAVQLLRSDRLRGYTISIETDSMVLQDQQAEKQLGIEFVTAVSGFLQQAIPAAQMYPEMKGVLSELLLFGIRQFKAASSLETAFEQVADAGADQPPQPTPDPAAAGEAAKAANDKQRLDQDATHKERLFGLEKQKTDHSMAVEDKKFQLAVAGQNKQIYDEASAEMQAPQASEQPQPGMSPIELMLAGIQSLAQQQSAQMAMLTKALTAPKKIVRGLDGRAVGVETVAPQTIQ